MLDGRRLGLDYAVDSLATTFHGNLAPLTLRIAFPEEAVSYSLKPVWSLFIYKTVSRKGKDGPTKSRRGSREVQLDEGAMRLLARHKMSQDREKLAFGEGFNPDNLVFTNKKGGRVLYMSAYYEFIRCSKKAGAPYITIHGCGTRMPRCCCGEDIQ